MSLIPYLTDTDISILLWEYDDNSFSDMPKWLQHTLQARSITFQRRDPTEREADETISDAREHRITNNEKTIQDFKDKYLHGKSFNIL